MTASMTIAVLLALGYIIYTVLKSTFFPGDDD